MNIFYPKFNQRFLPAMFGVTVFYAMIAGVYGILHDQITYSISPEYFTKMKFEQFQKADFGFPERVFVAEIGFLATWWAGLISGWLFSRIAIPAWPTGLAIRKISGALLIHLFITFAASTAGYLYGLHDSFGSMEWNEIIRMLGITDRPAFVRVGYIHNASYLGGLMGLIIAAIVLSLQKRNNLSRDRFKDQSSSAKVVLPR